MDNEMLFNMFLGMMEKMNDDELKTALSKSKSLLGPKDYDKLVELIRTKRNLPVD